MKVGVLRPGRHAVATHIPMWYLATCSPFRTDRVVLVKHIIHGLFPRNRERTASPRPKSFGLAVQTQRRAEGKRGAERRARARTTRVLSPDRVSRGHRDGRKDLGTTRITITSHPLSCLSCRSKTDSTTPSSTDPHTTRGGVRGGGQRVGELP